MLSFFFVFIYSAFIFCRLITVCIIFSLISILFYKNLQHSAKD